jgi:hypothetical protein
MVEIISIYRLSPRICSIWIVTHPFFTFLDLILLLIYQIIDIRTSSFLIIILQINLINLYFQLTIFVSHKPSCRRFMLVLVFFIAAIRIFFFEALHNLILVWNLSHHIATNFKVEILCTHFNKRRIQSISKTLSFSFIDGSFLFLYKSRIR